MVVTVMVMLMPMLTCTMMTPRIQLMMPMMSVIRMMMNHAAGLLTVFGGGPAGPRVNTGTRRAKLWAGHVRAPCAALLIYTAAAVQPVAQPQALRRNNADGDEDEGYARYVVMLIDWHARWLGDEDADVVVGDDNNNVAHLLPPRLVGASFLAAPPKGVSSFHLTSTLTSSWNATVRVRSRSPGT